MLTKDEIAKLLNRSLTESENTNFSLYLKIATKRLEQLLCMKLNNETEARSFFIREGYRTIFTDVFTGDVTVSVDGVEQEASTYSVRQFDNLNGDWFNSIVFKQHLPRTAEMITVTADWGFTCLPSDLKLLLARLFEFSTDNTDDRVKSKKIEDYSVTYSDKTAYDQLIESNSAIIDAYSVCVRSIRNGNVCTVR